MAKAKRNFGSLNQRSAARLRVLILMYRPPTCEEPKCQRTNQSLNEFCIKGQRSSNGNLSNLQFFFAKQDLFDLPFKTMKVYYYWRRDELDQGSPLSVRAPERSDYDFRRGFFRTPL